MIFPGYENIFSLSEPFATRPYRGSLSEERPRPDYLALTSGTFVPAQPIRIVPYGGREPQDFVWTDAAIIRLVSQRVIDLLRQNQIAGWSTYPVQLYDRSKNLIEGFAGFSVIGRSGKIDPSLSTPFQKQFPGGIFPHFKGCLFEPASWDGSDVFSPEGTAHIFTTRKVLELFEGSKVKNVRYRPITELDFGEYEKSLLEEKLRANS